MVPGNTVLERNQAPKNGGNMEEIVIVVIGLSTVAAVLYSAAFILGMI